MGRTRKRKKKERARERKEEKSRRHEGAEAPAFNEDQDHLEPRGNLLPNIDNIKVRKRGKEAPAFVRDQSRKPLPEALSSR